MEEKLILFDWGNVIQNGISEQYYNINIARKNVCNDMRPLEPENLISIFDKKQFWILNGTKYKNFINTSLKKAGSNFNYEYFAKSYLKFNEKIPYFENTINFINRIQQVKKCNIGILSNISILDVQQLKTHLNLDSFNFLFLSCELGIMKPDEKIYSIVEKISKVKPKNILFIDDREENIQEGKNHGWHVCLASGNEFSKIENACFSFLENQDLTYKNQKN